MAYHSYCVSSGIDIPEASLPFIYFGLPRVRSMLNYIPYSSLSCLKLLRLIVHQTTFRRFTQRRF